MVEACVYSSEEEQKEDGRLRTSRKHGCLERELKQSEEVVKRRSWQTSWQLGIRSVRAPEQRQRQPETLAEQEAQFWAAGWACSLVQ
jgi:hypothetical protein